MQDIAHVLEFAISVYVHTCLVSVSTKELEKRDTQRPASIRNLYTHHFFFLLFSLQ